MAALGVGDNNQEALNLKFDVFLSLLASLEVMHDAIS